MPGQRRRAHSAFANVFHQAARKHGVFRTALAKATLGIITFVPIAWHWLLSSSRNARCASCLFTAELPFGANGA